MSRVSRVETCSPEEAKAIIQRLSPGQRRNFGGHVNGHIDLVCKEADGSVAWEVHKSNITTSRMLLGRYPYGNNYFSVFISPCQTTPRRDQVLLPCLGPAPYITYANQLTSSYDALTLTKTWQTTFSTPSANVRIGTVGLGDTAQSPYLKGIIAAVAYTRLPTLKIQTTTQTLELQYKLTFVPAT